jgi:hypothetical protein
VRVVGWRWHKNGMLSRVLRRKQNLFRRTLAILIRPCFRVTRSCSHKAYPLRRMFLASRPSPKVWAPDRALFEDFYPAELLKSGSRTLA